MLKTGLRGLVQLVASLEAISAYTRSLSWQRWISLHPIDFYYTRTTLRVPSLKYLAAVRP